MQIKLINTKPFTFRVKNRDYEFVKPYYLMPGNCMQLIKPVIKGSTICWNINGITITYNQVRALIKKTPGLSTGNFSK